jgi:plasmid stabilization system protein ParE
MAAAKRVEVRAAANFLANLEDLGEFLLRVDPEAAPQLHRRLKAEIAEMLDLLENHPGIGRPARVLKARSIQGRERSARAAKVAHSLGLKELREYVLKDHLVLYACSDTAVVLLAVRHQRQLEYQL